MGRRVLFVAAIVAVFSGAAVSLAGATGPASVDGDRGDDRLRGGSGIDQIRGYAGDDTLDGGGAPDGLFGNSGSDRLINGGVGGMAQGGPSEDYLFGGYGLDRLDGGPGVDEVSGAAGDDRLEGGGGGDVLNGEGITYSASGAEPIDERTVPRDSTRLNRAAEGETTITYSARDHAGNVEDPKTLTVRLDKTAPRIDVATPADGAEYKLGEAVTAGYTCSDGGSGVDSCSGPVPDGGNVDTASVGPKTFTVEATDKAGNDASEGRTYGVVYDFSGYFSPVDNPDVLNRAQAGSAVPVKFGLSGDRGLDIFAEGYPRSQRITCDSAAPVDNIEQTVSAGESGLAYDASADQYRYVWKTSKAWGATCRQLVVKLDDGTVHQANFRFR